MGNIVLITGGARSGKSAFAEGLLATAEPVCYLATNATAQDAEMQARIQKHQQRRSADWQTHEGFLELAAYIAAGAAENNYLLDCATMLTTNYFYAVMKQTYGEDYLLIDQKIATFTEAEKTQWEQRLLLEWQQIITSCRKINGTTVIVTNEVGLGLVPENAFSRWFRDLYGRVNQYLGKEADAAYLVMAGIPLKIK